jgi:hypothetical protein
LAGIQLPTEIAAPIERLGVFAAKLLLDRYMRRLLEQRNAVIKRAAESDAWRNYLAGS